MLALALVLACAAAPQEPPLGLDGPTPEESLALELLNRFRADPRAEAARLAVLSLPRAPHPDLDLDLFLKELESVEPAPPLVFDPHLAQAGRSHGAYTISNAHWGHEETAGLPGFTGQWTRDRLEHLGFPHLERIAECAKGKSWGPLEAHWSCIVDDGPGPGGMQAGRGHRAACAAPRFRLAGIGFAPWPDGRHHAVVHVFSAGDPRARYFGGVCYADLDEDGFYDVGEGLGQVLLRSRGGRPFEDASSWSSGAWTAEVSGLDTQSVEVSGSLLGLDVVERAARGRDNAKLDFDFGPAIRARVSELVHGLGRGPSAARRASIELGFWRERCPSLVPADERGDGVWAEWVTARDGILRALAVGDLGAARARARADRAAWSGTSAGPLLEDVTELVELLERLDDLARERAGARRSDRVGEARESLRALRRRILERRFVPAIDAALAHAAELR